MNFVYFFRSVVTQETDVSKKARLDALRASRAEAEEKYWKSVYIKQESFKNYVLTTNPGKSKPSFPQGFAMVAIFVAILTPDLPRLVWNSYSTDHWTYSSGYEADHVGRAKYNYRQIMVVLAVYIFITGMETGPNEADPV